MFRLDRDYPACFRLAAVTALSGLLATVLICRFLWSQWRGGESGTGKPVAAVQSRVAQAGAASNLSVETQRMVKVQAAVEHWKAHRAYWRQVFNVQYPNALAAAHPPVELVHALTGFQQKYVWEFMKRLPAKDAQGHVRTNPIDDKMGHDLNNAHNALIALSYLEAAQDSTPVTDTLTIGDLAQRELLSPTAVLSLRSSLINVEASNFQDMTANETLKSLDSGADLLAYLKQAKTRYEALAQASLDRLPVDEDVRDYYATTPYFTRIVTLTAFYGGTCQGAPEAIVTSFREMEGRALNLPLLEELSRDDEEARRLLTELKGLENQIQQAKAAVGQ